MQFQLDHVIPEPLAGNLDPQTDIWDRSVNFKPGNLYRVFAPSGTGKSTFILAIYGLRKDYTGSVKINEDPVLTLNDDKFSDLRSKDISIIFQDLRLFQDLTSWENIQLKKELSSNVSDEYIEMCMEKLSITKLKNQRAATLSYGERQRVAIVRALIQPFTWLLADEPFSHLDEQNIAIARELIVERCRAQKAGMIMTTLGYDYDIDFDISYRL